MRTMYAIRACKKSRNVRKTQREGAALALEPNIDAHHPDPHFTPKPPPSGIGQKDEIWLKVVLSDDTHQHAL